MGLLEAQFPKTRIERPCPSLYAKPLLFSSLPMPGQALPGTGHRPSEPCPQTFVSFHRRGSRPGSVLWATETGPDLGRALRPCGCCGQDLGLHVWEQEETHHPAAPL